MMRIGRIARRLVWVMVASILGALPAFADSSIAFNGYGTLGGTFTSDGAYAYRHDSTEFVGAGNQLDIGVDSRLGLQAVVDFSNQFSVTAQEVFKRRGAESFSPGTEWFYAQYDVTPYVDLRLGRFAIDTFLLSDSINVGYAAIWFHAPNEIYASEPFKFLDGMQAHWAVFLGEVRLKLEAAFGQTTIDLKVGEEDVLQTAKYGANVAVALGYRNWLLRIADTHVSAPLTLPLGPTHSLAYTTRDQFLAAGLRYDDGRALLLSEWTRRTQNDVPLINIPLAAGSQYYVGAGWHAHLFTPMVVYGVYKPGVQLISPPGQHQSWSGVLRYDVMRNVALKAQFARTDAGNTRFWVTPNFSSPERINVYSVGADFVF